MKKTELLSPAGNMEKLKMVLHYGADGVYLGGEQFNLRSLADNFNKKKLKEAVDYVHNLNKKIYITLNIIPHNRELKGMVKYVKYLEEIEVDGVIVADLGVFEIVSSNTNLNINISTQANNTNWQSVKMWKKLGAKRVILARELSLEEIKEIREKVPDIELEVFIHGAMCMAISGRCLLSNYMTNRDANRGTCAQSCRWKYHLMEEKRPGEYFPVFEDERGTHIFNSKDLCSIKFIDEILDIGLDSLKIEGRMKGIYYAAIVTKIYRNAIDKYYSKEGYRYNEDWLTELETTSHRKFTSGFYYGRGSENMQNYDRRNSYSRTHKLIAKVLKKTDDNTYEFGIRNRIRKGTPIEIVSTDNKIIKIVMPTMIDISTDEEILTAHPNTTIRVKIKKENLQEMDIIRVRLDDEK
ncbi:MAG: peptidase U32 family protein [Fusobacteriota bacterium]